MKVNYKSMKGKLLDLVNDKLAENLNGKHLELVDVIPTTRISRSLVANSLSSEVEVDTVLDGIKRLISNSRNGIRIIADGKAVQLVTRKGDNPSKEIKKINNVIAFMNIDESDEIIALYDNIDVNDGDCKILSNISKESRFTSLPEELNNTEDTVVEEVVEQPKKPEYPIQANTMTIPMIIGAHTGMLWREIKDNIPDSELVELEDGEDSIDFIRYEMIKQNTLKGYMINYLCKMDNFIFSNLCDTDDHKNMVPRIWNIIHEEIPKYHKDKTDKKDYNFIGIVNKRILHYLRDELSIELANPFGVQKDKTEVETSNKDDDTLSVSYEVSKVKAAENKDPEPKEEPLKEEPEVKYIPTKEEEDQFNKDLAEVEAAVKEIEEKAKPVNHILKNKEINDIMVRKIKSNSNKTQATQQIAAENAHLKESVRVAYTGVIKSILVHMQTWDLEDLVAVLLEARNNTVKLYENGKDKERNREIIVALQRCAMWISEVWRNRENGINDIYCVEMEPNEYIFAIERANVPWVIDHKTLGMILQFDSPNKEINVIDMNRAEFVNKHIEFMRASGLLNPLMHDDLSIIPVDAIIKKDKK